MFVPNLCWINYERAKAAGVVRQNVRAEIKVMLKNSHKTVMSLARECESARHITAASLETIIFGVGEKRENGADFSEGMIGVCDLISPLQQQHRYARGSSHRAARLHKDGKMCGRNSRGEKNIIM